MDWSFELIGSPEFIRVLTTGAFSSNDFAAMFDDLISLEYWRFGIPLLIDGRKLEFAQADPMEHMAASDQFISRNQSFAFTPIAIVFDSAESFEIGKRFGYITNGRIMAEVRMFLNAQDAVEWIASFSES